MYIMSCYTASYVCVYVCARVMWYMEELCVYIYL